MSVLTLTAAMALAAASTAFAAPAQEIGTFVFTQASSDSEVLTISDGNLQVDNGYAGIYSGTLNGQPISIFCVDPDHSITDNQSYQADYGNLATAAPASTTTNGYYDGGLGSEINSSDAAPNENYSPSQLAIVQKNSEDEIAWLADTYLDPTSGTFGSIDSGLSLTADTAVNEAAVNVAIWDIVENDGQQMNAGEFTSTQGDTSSAYASLTNEFLSLASSEIDYSSSTAYWLQAPDQTSSHGQNYIYKDGPTPTPEVSPASAMGIGFCGILLALGIRARRSALKA